MSSSRGSHGFTTLVKGLALGATAMYLLDPDRGRRRRAIARDKLRRFANDSVHLGCQAARDTTHRVRGTQARLQQRLAEPPALDELRLIERVRSALGRAVTHPHALQVGAHGTTVVLSGPILRHELVPLMAAVQSVAGVEHVQDHLDVHDQDDRLPSLQGGGRRNGNGAGGLQTWPPGARLGLLLTGMWLVLYGAAKHNLRGALFAGAGVALARRVLEPGDAPQGHVASASEASHRGRVAREPETGTARGIGADGTPERPLADTGAAMAEAPSALAPESDAAAANVSEIGQDGTPSRAAMH